MIRDYVAAQFPAEKSGDPTAMLALTDGTCQACERHAARITSAYQNGGRVKSGLNTVVSITAVDGALQSATHMELLVITKVAPATVFPGKGQTPERFTGGLSHQNFHLTGDGTSWVIDEIYRAAS